MHLCQNSEVPISSPASRSPESSRMEINVINLFLTRFGESLPLRFLSTKRRHIVCMPSLRNIKASTKSGCHSELHKRHFPELPNIPFNFSSCSNASPKLKYENTIIQKIGFHITENHSFTVWLSENHIQCIMSLLLLFPGEGTSL